MKLKKNISLKIFLVVIFALVLSVISEASEFIKFENSYQINDNFQNKRALFLNTYKDKIGIMGLNVNTNNDNNINYILLQIGDKTHEIVLPNKQFKPNYYLPGFCFNDSMLVINDFQNYYIYKLSIKDEYEFVKEIQTIASCTNIQLENNNIVGYNFHNMSDNKDKQTQTYLTKTNINTGSSSIVYFQNPKGIHLAKIRYNKFIDYHSGKVIITDVSTYNIKIFDIEGSQLDSIYRDMTHISKYSEKKFTNIIEEYKGRFFINQVWFANSKKIVVLWSGLDSNKQKIICYDIWENENNNWLLKKKDLVQAEIDSSSFIDPNNFAIPSSAVISNDRIINIEFFPFDIEEWRSKTYIEFKKESEEYLIDNPLRYKLIIREIL